MASFEGPLPPPGWFEHYDRVVPGAGGRIIAIAEHASACHGKLLLRGQIFGFVLALVSLVSATVLVSLDKNAAGAVVFFSTFAPIVYAFLRRRKE